MPYSREEQRRYARLHYDANKALYKSRAKRCTQAVRKNLRAELNRLKAVPCVDCEQEPGTQGALW